VSFDYKAKRFVSGAGLPPLERHLAWKEIFSSDLRGELLSAQDRGVDPIERYRARFSETDGCMPLARLQDIDLGIYLPDDLLVKVDRASMAHSLEARVPFLDPVVAELALALPDGAKIRGFSKKRLLRRALAPLLPQTILDGKKHGFSVPLAAWLREELQEFTRDVLSPAAVARQGIFRPEAVTRLIEMHVTQRDDLSRQLWNLLCFTLWFDRYASGSAAAGGAVGIVAAGKGSR
jgi:asparagine synthase (glutamine-hydrolysing)